MSLRVGVFLSGCVQRTRQYASVSVAERVLQGNSHEVMCLDGDGLGGRREKERLDRT